MAESRHRMTLRGRAVGYALAFLAGALVSAMLVFAAAGPRPEQSPASRTQGATRKQPPRVVLAVARPSEPAAPPRARRTQAYLVGVLAATERVDVVADGAGRLRTVHVAVGDPVRAGEVVAELSLDELEHLRRAQQARAREARVAEDTARLELGLARSNAQRRERLPELFSEEERERAVIELDQAVLALEAARARSAAAAAEVSLLDERADRRRILAPIDGLVSERFADAGAAVSQGQPIVQLVSTPPWVVRFAVPPDEQARYPAGTQVRVEVADRPGAACATVERIAPKLDDSSHLLFLEARLTTHRLDELPLGTGVRVRVAQPGDCRESDV